MESIVKSVNPDNGLSFAVVTRREPSATLYAVGHGVVGAGSPANSTASGLAGV
jgi:hypothetical protein